MDACVSFSVAKSENPCDGGVLDFTSRIEEFSIHKTKTWLSFLGRLVEVNVSPLYRADIPASNGVIHVVDWILKPDDRDWCNGIILPRRK